MATKLEIQNLIASNIRSNTALIDKTEHADVEDALLLNSYGTTINETTTINNITLKNSSNPLIQYNVFFCKQGRKVTIKGFLINASTSIISGESSYFFEIVNSDYFQSNDIDALGGFPTICAKVSGDPAKVYIKNNKICVDFLEGFGVVNLNIEYLTQN